MSSADGSAARPLEVVKVPRELLAACMTCPICKKLLKDATTISECLHTFCRKCILEKLNDEEVECCPVCDVSLGCDPVEKLRTDHNLQDIRAKVFPLRKRKVDAPEVASEVAPSLTLPVRRKERSLSSLVVNTPRVSSNSTGRRTKVMTRGISRLSPKIIETVNKEDKDFTENSSAHETTTKLTYNKRQNLGNAEASNRTPNRESENGEEPYADKSELWKPLNCLVEAANRTRALKSGPSSPRIKADQNSAHEDNKNNVTNSMIQDDTNDEGVNGSGSMAPVIRRRRRRRRDVTGKPTIQALIDATRATAPCERRLGPIWLSIVPSFDQQQNSTPPQQPACYLRIKDGGLPVSFIQKYLVKKLNISAEAEQQIEIQCQGQRVDPKLPLHSLADIWLQHRPTSKAHASLGASAKDFVMVLNYKYKPQAP